MLSQTEERETPVRTAYLNLARILAVLVIVQAMTIVFAVAGLFNWVINKGGVLDAAVVESWEQTPPTFTGSIGHFIHAFINGQMVLPLVALLLLIVSFFAKVPKGVAIAVAIVVLVALQVLSGLFADGTPYLGLWHGLGAFLIFGATMAAAMAAKRVDQPVSV
jgi:hypothetical protein